jgi:hypothetical protein
MDPLYNAHFTVNGTPAGGLAVHQALAGRLLACRCESSKAPPSLVGWMRRLSFLTSAISLLWGTRRSSPACKCCAVSGCEWSTG